MLPVYAKAPHGTTPLHIAAQHGDEEEVLRLIKEGANLEAIDEKGKTPLWCALPGGISPKDIGHEKIVELLISHGADVDARVRDQTPLHYTTLMGKTRFVELLIRLSADIEAQSDPAGTSLHLSVTPLSNFETLQLVLTYSNNVNIQNTDGHTPLHIATMWSNTLAIKELINHHAPILMLKHLVEKHL